MFFSDGEVWQESRRFTVKHLRAFGKEQTENLMKEEIDILSSAIKDDSIIQVINTITLLNCFLGYNYTFSYNIQTLNCQRII